MYILTKLEYSVLKSIHDHLSSNDKDPVMNPVHIGSLEGVLDTQQIKITINAMVVFNFVKLLGETVIMTPKGHEMFKNAHLMGDILGCSPD